jgi:hypothetical protein
LEFNKLYKGEAAFTLSHSLGAGRVTISSEFVTPHRPQRRFDGRGDGNDHKCPVALSSNHDYLPPFFLFRINSSKGGLPGDQTWRSGAVVNPIIAALLRVARWPRRAAAKLAISPLPATAALHTMQGVAN